MQKRRFHIDFWLKNFYIVHGWISFTFLLAAISFLFFFAFEHFFRRFSKDNPKQKIKTTNKRIWRIFCISISPFIAVMAIRIQIDDDIFHLFVFSCRQCFCLWIHCLVFNIFFSFFSIFLFSVWQLTKSYIEEMYTLKIYKTANKNITSCYFNLIFIKTIVQSCKKS